MTELAHAFQISELRLKRSFRILKLENSVQVTNAVVQAVLSID
ncbi:hypothetical protein DSOL_1078 [Desulfosporosinus metallidurans]|uniref:EAL domain-containing protein n=1 Tax=Desulfosporosinus metallidurans TaxID=1888891 RepID=A0A1Q8R047_9FIRM|nr:hypothetical protein DSOL_1078 [Desulfosporosinus metallidurans]